MRKILAVCFLFGLSFSLDTDITIQSKSYDGNSVGGVTIKTSPAIATQNDITLQVDSVVGPTVGRPGNIILKNGSGGSTILYGNVIITNNSYSNVTPSLIVNGKIYGDGSGLSNINSVTTYPLNSNMVYGIDFTDESILPVFNCVLTSVGNLAFFSFFISGASNSTEFGIDLPVVSFQNYAISPKLQCSDNDGFHDDGVASLVDFDPVRVKFGRGLWGLSDWLPTMYKMISGSIVFPIIQSN